MASATKQARMAIPSWHAAATGGNSDLSPLGLSVESFKQSRNNDRPLAVSLSQ